MFHSFSPLLFGGGFLVDGTVGSHNVSDTFFDRTTIDTNLWFGTTNHHNGYITNCARLWPEGTNNVILAGLAYEAGPLGLFYQPTNSPLINAGSVPAGNAGLYHFTTTTNQVRETNSTVDIGFHYLALTNGAPFDSDGDGLLDYAEDANRNGTADTGETTWLHSDTDYDGRSDADEIADGTDPLNAWSVKLVRLGHWRFDDTTLAGDEGQQYKQAANVTPPVASWSGSAVYITNTSFLRYREIETNGRPNINCRNGTVRFWFKPDWSSTNLGGTGPQNDTRLIELGGYSADASLGHWELGLEPSGTKIHFASASNGLRADYFTAPVGFTAGRWHQIALSYSPSNVALYFNGLVMTNQNLLGGEDNTRPYSPTTNYWINSAGPGIYNYPPPDIRAVGFTIGCDSGGNQQAKGQFEELETFNYPLTPQQIAGGFPGFNGASAVTNDFDYDGRSDILEAQVDGTTTNNASSVTGGRLGYWRFNGATNSLLGEALQTPLLVSGVSVTPGWSSNALVISSSTTSGLIYRDVETNGWANFNCRYGAVRFWFRPGYGTGGPGTDAPFLYLGSAASPNNGQWELGVSANGKAVKFITASNSTPSTLMTANVDLTSNRWHHVAFNYGPNNLALYVNGALVTNLATGLSKYPALVYRLEGLALGNSTARTRPVNGQFDELETFNRQLTATEIQRSFDAVKATDDNLNGTVDLLEDVVLSGPVPFAGFPFVITGTMEAEQFDRGGEGVPYHSLGGNTVTNDYRPSGMQIVTNTTDRGAGFLVDNLRAGEWLKYTLDVRVGQNYAVDARVAGLGTGGVFHIEFATNATSAAYTNTGPITVGTTNWTNLVRTLLPLRAGTNIMKVVMDTNSASGKVCQLNYISIYPSWVEGATNLVVTNDLVTGSYGYWRTNTDWGSAKTNAATLQNAINSLSLASGQGGVVRIPSGTYYLAQGFPQEASNKDAQDNTAVFVSKSNVQIEGAGKTNTVLVAHNRATTLFYIGRDTNQFRSSVTNFNLAALNFEGRPHLVAVRDPGSGGYTNCWDDGVIDPNGLTQLGHLLVVGGKDEDNLVRSVLVTNCLFRNASITHLVIPEYTRDFSIRGCDFFMRDGTNGALLFRTNSTPCHTNATTTFPYTGVSVWIRASGCQNFLMFDCTFNGSPAMSAVNTNYQADAADGLFWGQQGGNWFISRCAITNYGLEGVQFGAGPAAATGNEYHTLVSLGATCGLFALPYWGTPTDATNDQTFYLVGNTISGGRIGYKGAPTGYGTLVNYATAHVSGNALDLFPAFPLGLDAYDGIGGAVVVGNVQQAMVSGNVMAAGERGVWWLNGCASSVLLKNDFGSASYQGLTYSGTNGPQHHFVILRNMLNQGHRFHLQTTGEDARSYFFGENVFKAGTNTVSPFIVPIAAPAHIRY